VEIGGGKLNMTACGEGGCLMRYMGPMGSGYGKRVGGGGVSSLDL